jgi:hypothetical protein
MAIARSLLHQDYIHDPTRPGKIAVMNAGQGGADAFVEILEKPIDGWVKVRFLKQTTEGNQSRLTPALAGVAWINLRNIAVIADYEEIAHPPAENVIKQFAEPGPSGWTAP